MAEDKKELTPEEQMQKASDALLYHVFIPAFREKLARDYELELEDHEVGPCLEIAAKLKAKGATPMAKTSSDSFSEFLKAASDALDDVPDEGAVQGEQMDKLAEALLQHPEVAEAVSTVLGKTQE